jgi:Leucine-rich repeat (LRR) protein
MVRQNSFDEHKMFLYSVMNFPIKKIKFDKVQWCEKKYHISNLPLIYLDCYYNNNFDNDDLKPLKSLECLLCGPEIFSMKKSDYVSRILDFWSRFHMIFSNVGLSGCPKFTDGGIRKLHNLRYLYCGSCIFTDNGIRNLGKLRYLSCGICEFTNKGLENLRKLIYLDCGFKSLFTDYKIRKLTNLRYLGIGLKTKITGKSLSRLEDLTHLSLDANNNLANLCNGDSHVLFRRAIRNLKRLVYLDLGGYHSKCMLLYDDDIRKLINLRYLRFSYDYPTYVTKHVTDTGIENLIRLEYLECGENSFTDRGVRKLINLKCLKTNDSQIFTNKGIMKLKNLEYLSINGRDTSITNSGMKYLKKLRFMHLRNYHNIRIVSKIFKNLEYLICYGNMITNSTLKKLNNLKCLVIYGDNNITDDTLRCLKKLVCLVIRGKNITNRGIRNLINLRYLICSNNDNIEEDGIKKLRFLEYIIGVKKISAKTKKNINKRNGVVLDILQNLD